MKTKDNFQEIKTKVTDVKYKNNNGTSRQDLLKISKKGDQLFLVPYPKDYNETAVKVMSSSLNEQLGWLEGNLSEKMFNEIKNGNEYKAEIAEIIETDEKHKSLECIINIKKIKNHNISSKEKEINLRTDETLKYKKLKTKFNLKSSLGMLTYKMHKAVEKMNVFGCLLTLILLISIFLYIFL